MRNYGSMTKAIHARSVGGSPSADMSFEPSPRDPVYPHSALLLLWLRAMVVVACMGYSLSSHVHADEQTDKEDAEQAGQAEQEKSRLRAEPIRTARALLVVIFYGAVLVVVVLVGTLVVARIARRYREDRKPAAPTPAEDVWSMHILPGEYDPGDPHDHDGPDEHNDRDGPDGHGDDGA